MLNKTARLVEISREEGIGSAMVAVKRELRRYRYKAQNNPIESLKRGRLLSTAGILTEQILGRNLYIEHLRRSQGNPAIVLANGYQMFVDLDDPGLSNDLVAYGEREVHSTKALRSELERLKTESEEPVTILEVGANIGYFALLEASVLGRQADIHAIEASPTNIDLLKKNVELNGFSDQFNITHAAIGAESGTAELELSVHSNQNFLISGGVDADTKESTGKRINVDELTLDDYLDEVGVDPEDVDVLRMDVQGAEYEVLKGAQSLLNADSDLVFFLETHPAFVPDGKQDELVDWLKQADFKPVHSASNFKTPEKFPSKRVDTVDDLRTTGTEAILRR